MSSLKLLVYRPYQLDLVDQNGNVFGSQPCTYGSSIGSCISDGKQTGGNVYELMSDGSSYGEKSFADLIESPLPSPQLRPLPITTAAMGVINGVAVLLSKNNEIYMNGDVKPLKTSRPNSVLVGFKLSPEGNYLVAWSDQEVLLYSMVDVFNDETDVLPAMSLPIYNGSVTSIALSCTSDPDAVQLIAVGTSSGHLHLWCPSVGVKILNYGGTMTMEEPSEWLNVESLYSNITTPQGSLAEPIVALAILGSHLYIARADGAVGVLWNVNDHVVTLLAEDTFAPEGSSSSVKRLVEMAAFTYLDEVRVMLRWEKGSATLYSLKGDAFEVVKELGSETNPVVKILAVDNFHVPYVISSKGQKIKLSHPSVLRIAAAPAPKFADFASHHPVYDVPLDMPDDEEYVNQALAVFAREFRFTVERADAKEELVTMEPVLSVLRSLTADCIASTCPPDPWATKWGSDFEPSNAKEAEVFELLDGGKVKECCDLLLQSFPKSGVAMAEGIKKWFSFAQYRASIPG